MVDALQATGAAGALVQAEVGVVQRRAFLALLHQVDQAAIRGAHCRHLTFIGADQPTERLAAEVGGALQRRVLVLDPQRGGAQRWAVGLEEVVAKGVGLGVEHDVDVVLA
ncbi:hypothetical protein D3C73_1380520 [compost metagenome]